MKVRFVSVLAGALAMTPAVGELAAAEAADSVMTRPAAGVAGDPGPSFCAHEPAAGKPGAMLVAAAVTGRPDAAAARARIQAMGDSAIQVLQREDLREAERQRRFRTLLRSNFQVQAIGTLALGRHRAGISPRQRREFDRLFSQFVVVRVSDLLDDYTNESFQVNDVVNAGRKDVAVRSRIVPKRGEATDVYWVMREFNGRPQVIDVRVDNISLVITQRDEFNSIIQREGVDALLVRLRDQVQGRSAERPG